MPEETLLLVESYIDGKLHVFDKDWPELPFAHREHIGCTVDYVAGRNRYMGYLISLGVYSFRGVKVGLDCANGSSWNIAKSVLVASMASFSIFCFWTTSSVLEGSSFRSLLTSFSPDCVPLIDLFTLSSALESFVVSPPISTVMPWILDAICVTTSSQA